MLLSLLSKFNPYLLWIKIGVVVVLCASSFWAGVKWETAATNAMLLEAERSHQNLVEQIRAENERILLEQEKAREVISKRLIQVRKETQSERQKAQRRIIELRNRADQCVVDLELERVWRLNNGEASGGLPEVDPTTGRTLELSGSCTEADLLSNHADLVARYNELREKHLALQEWAKQAVDITSKPR